VLTRVHPCTAKAEHNCQFVLHAWTQAGSKGLVGARTEARLLGSSPNSAKGLSRCRRRLDPDPVTGA